LNAYLSIRCAVDTLPGAVVAARHEVPELCLIRVEVSS
jgi:hypothetical protein